MAGNERTNNQELYYRSAWEGDYSNFEKLAPEAREELANRYMDEITKRTPQLGKMAVYTNLPFTMERSVNGLLEEQSMNPLFRLGCSLRAKSEEDIRSRQIYQQYDDYMNTYLMKQTLSPMDNNRIQALRDQGMKEKDVNEMVGHDVEKQTMLAKTLFLSHLGKAQLVVEGRDGAAPEKKPLDRPISSMMAHCSRTAYVFPTGNGAQQDKLFDAVLGPDMGRDAGVFRRLGATHKVSSGPTIDDFQEKKGFSMLNQHGMNVAIGGLGNPGIGGPNGPQALVSDGTCGHMYMHVDKGGANKCGSILVGFESDSPNKTNQQGHTHDTKATPEAMSSFLGQRSDEMGMKYGGRIVDCTHLSPEKLTEAVNEFASHYRTLLTEGMENSAVRAELSKINDSLCGTPMTRMELTTMMGRMGIEKEKIKDIVDSPVYSPEKMEPAECVSQLNFNQEIPKKPSPWTMVKAAFGGSNSKRACEEYKGYQAELAGRAERGMDPERRKVPAKNSLQQYLGNLGTETPWKNAKANISMMDDRERERPQVGIGYHRQSEAERSKYTYVPNRGSSTRQPRREREPLPVPPDLAKIAAQKAAMGQPGNANPEAQQTTLGQPDAARPAAQQTSMGQPGNAKAVAQQTSMSEPGIAKPAAQQTSMGQPGNVKAVAQQTSMGQPGNAKAVAQQTPLGQPDAAKPAAQQTSMGQPGNVKPAAQQTSMGAPDTALPDSPAASGKGHRLPFDFPELKADRPLPQPKPSPSAPRFQQSMSAPKTPSTKPAPPKR